MLETLEIETVQAPVSAQTLAASRRVIFISHATPQDNVFAGWLAAQLAIAGYEVWCDVTKLLGGEAWWSDIDEAIDAASFRVLFVSTLEGNRKPGTLRELRLAFETQKKHGLKDFVIPLKIDEFPFASMQQSLQDLNCVRFDGTWATGLAALLKLLAREGAPKSADVGPACVYEWYKQSIDQNRRIVVSRNQCFSNWFPITLPEKLHLHCFRGPADSLPVLAEALGLPHKALGSHLITFASASEVESALGAHFSETVTCSTKDFIESGLTATPAIAPFDAMNIVCDLVRQAWISAMEMRSLAFHENGNGHRAWFFKKGQLDKERGYYESDRGKRGFRQLVGNKSKRKLDGTREPDGFWHYAVSARPMLHPVPRLVLNYHVIFTDDGETPWSSVERMVKARRRVCKQWWNPEWRDRLKAFVGELGAGAKEIAIPLGDVQSLHVSLEAIQFTSPWTYYEDGRDRLNEAADVELFEEEEDDDEE